MKKLLLTLMGVAIYVAGSAQVRQDINSFTPAQRTTLVNLMQDYITPEVIEMHCQMIMITGGMIHSDFDFLPFHRMYLEGLEDYLYLHGHSEFVPLPKWDPDEPNGAPSEFRVLDSDCSSAGCTNNPPGNCFTVNDITWTPNKPLPYYLKLTPVQVGSNNDLCDWELNPSAPSSENCCMNGLSRMIEGTELFAPDNPVNLNYHNSVHVAMSGVMGNFRSPSAPIFWLWHGYVDDIFKTWECNCSNSNNNRSVDLYMKDTKKTVESERDRGMEPNIDQGAMCVSGDIWVRNGTDGQSTDEHQNPQYAPGGSNTHVYVRVRNRGCDDYTGGAQLRLYWSKASTGSSWPNSWNGNNNQPGQPPMSEAFPAQTIPAIVAGGQTIMEFDWNDVPNPLDYDNEFASTSDIMPLIDQHHFCLLARIDYVNDPMTFPEGSVLVDNVRNNNNIVWKNISVVDENGDNGAIGGIVGIGNPTEFPQVFDFNFDNAEVFGQNSPLTDEAEIRVALDNAAWNKWLAGGQQGANISIADEGAHEIMITGTPASLNNLSFAPREQNKIGLMVNFLTKKSTEQRVFDYDVAQIRASDGKAIGWERFHVLKPERIKSIEADAGSNQEITDEESAQLAAASVNEPAVYNWYDQNDSLIYSGTNFTVTPELTTQYKLKVVADADGFTDYDSVIIKVKDCYLKSVYPNPVTSSVTVGYKTRNVSSAYLIITRPYSSISNNYILDLNQNQKNIDLSMLPSGNYTVFLVCDGQTVDSKSISKL